MSSKVFALSTLVSLVKTVADNNLENHKVSIKKSLDLVLPMD